MTGLTDRSVRRAIADLVERGLISREINAGGTPDYRDDRRPNLYTLAVSRDERRRTARGFPRPHHLNERTVRHDWIDAKLDLAQLRDRPLPVARHALELELAIVRVERARNQVRSAVPGADEKLAKFHLNMAAAHLAKLTKLHPALPTWKPKKTKKPAK